MKWSIVFCFLLLVIISCKDKDDNSTNVDFKNIFFDFEISGNEGDDQLTVLVKFREVDEEGKAMTLPNSIEVLLDDTKLIMDSSKMTGSFYELHVPANTFNGKHVFAIMNEEKKIYEEAFSYYPLIINSAIPESITRDECIIDLDEHANENAVRIVLTDTVFENDGINEIDTIRNGQIIIDRAALQSVASGPVQLELILENHKQLSESPSGEGRLLINYSVKRSFILQD